MDLLQVIIPEPANFKILLDDDEEIRITGYENIEINFCDRIVVKDNRSITVQSPMITYTLRMDSKSKSQLKTIFSDAYAGTFCTMQMRQGRIKVGRHGYVFNVEIYGRPDMQESFLLPRKYKDVIKIFLKLENTSVSLFDRADDAYEKYTRFEILDL
jgi:hypothetical protein